MKSSWLLVGLAAALLSACGGAASSGSTASQPVAAAQENSTYQPESDVAAHAAIGKDMADIRALLEPAQDGGEADFAAAEAVWSEGKNSQKDDGPRTLAGFVEHNEIAGRVDAAFEGRGPAADFDPAQRRQWIDKGMTAALEIKVLDELDAALEKVQAGETDSAEGAPHNVDEAWAFYTADGEGLLATAEKREADFELEGQVSESAITALARAQSAAKEGNTDDLRAAREDVRSAMNEIFALAVIKYAHEAVDDKVARAEGMAFSWGLRSDLSGLRLKQVQTAFKRPSAKAADGVRDALNQSLKELGLDKPLPKYTG